MKASKSIKNKIKAWEGFRPEAYLCPSGVLTIGYGHTGSDVKPGDTINHAQADELFEKDIARFERELQDAMAADNINTLTQGQYDALLSFAYNVGMSKLRSSTLWRKVKANPFDPTIGTEFCKWVHSGKNVLPGLVKRRREEANIYRS